MADVKKCDKPDCPRVVPIGVLYCCGACSYADGNFGKGEKFDMAGYEGTPLGHSESCDKRHAERGPWEDPRRRALRLYKEETDRLVAARRDADAAR
jgi:hypothetical protein